MSLGKLIGFSGALEQKFALASINFDFSLVKYEAPAEYKELGMALSKQRSREGEEGLSHVTARQLGALFEDLIPKTPNLVRAYGLRASEIARSPTYNPKGSPADGIFADQIGADGTTIWAAATSGSFTIAMHLLACMLARIWDAPQAVSVWTEIICERKRILSKLSGDDPVNVSSIAAAQIRISREQVAQWDSGARAWLRTADEAKRLAHTQLLLIINNVGIPVDVECGVYSSVIHAWQTAMETVEKLLGGEGQSIRIGAPLLALSAWHLYPDMLVLGTTTKSIKQNDELMPIGSLVTLGLQGKDFTDKGIYWSLPLAHLRYYGDPVTSTSTLNLNRSRVSISQLLQVALGAFLTNWGNDELMAAETLALVVDLVRDCPAGERFNLGENWSSNWLGVLGDAAKELLQSAEPQRSEYLKLFRAGRRRYQSILANAESLPSVLGLTLPGGFIEMMKGPEERVRALRKITANTPHIADVVIQYKIDGRWECASAIPSEVSMLVISTKRKRDGSHVRYTPMNKYTRWLLPVKEPDLTLVLTSYRSQRWKKYMETVEKLTQRAAEIEKMGENVVWVDPNKFPDFADQFMMYNSEAPTGFFDRGYDARKSSEAEGPKKRDFTPLRFLMGESGIAALYNVKDESGGSECAPTLKSLNQALKQSIVSAKLCEANVLKALHGWQGCGPHVSLCALATVARLYKALPGATIPLEVAIKPLHEGKWIPRGHQNGGHRAIGHNFLDLSLEEEFACLVLFDSGGFNLEPSSLKAVMAMSSGNLIFIPKRLLSDPWDDDTRGPAIKSIIGNLGRPGIAMLMPPQSPRMRELGHDSWTQISHNHFDGKLENNFQHTTLHLTFSDYELPIDVGHHGLRDRQIYFLEAPVSVHDHGEWVGDLDVLKALNSENLRRRPICTGHNTSERADESLFSCAVSLDNWEELLGSPADTAIVRAHGNWQARLAAMVLSIQRGHVTHVLPHEVCWICSLDGEKEQESTETDEERTENDEESIETDEEDDESLRETDDGVSVEINEGPSIILIA